MNKVKRSLVVTTISVAALVGTVGCTAAPVASGPVEIEYLGWVPGLQDSVDLWNSENPDIQVKLTTSTGSAEANPAIRAGVQAGNAPCMAQMAYFSLPNFVADGLLMPITDVASQYESQFLDWTWKAASAGGEVYGIPQDSGPMVMFYNKAKYDEYGISVPTTWDEFAAASAAVKAIDPTVSLGFVGPDDIGNYAGLVAQAGGSWTSIQGDEWKVGINDAAALKVADYFQGLIDRNETTVTPRFDAGIYPLLNDGKILTLIGASWNNSYLPANVPAGEGNWRVAQMPKWPGSDATANHGGSASVVLKGCEHPAEAAKFAVWLNSSEASMNMLMAKGGLYPAAIDAFGFDILKTGVPYYGGQVINDEFAKSAANVDPSWTFGPTYDGTATAYSDGFAGVVSGEKTLVDVANDVQASTLDEMNSRGIKASSR